MLDLRQYVPGGRVSTGLIARRDGRLFWALAQRKYWRQTDHGIVVPLVGIGGGQEPGETLPVTVAREAHEEAATTVAVHGAPSTLWVWPDEDRTQWRYLADELAGEPAPALIWQRTIDYIDEGGNTRRLAYIAAVYEADLLDEPQPAGEIVGLLALTLPDTRRLLTGALSLADLIAAGAVYRGVALPADAMVELQGSAAIVAQHWHPDVEV